MNQQSAMTMQVQDRPGNEVFALTDEQILGMETEGQEFETTPSNRELANSSQGTSTAAAAVAGCDDRVSSKGLSTRDEKGAQAGVPVPQEPPAWLAREMKDPWVGDEARELWEGVQRAQREAVAYREAFATPEEARALKEIYPGGVAEAKSAAERARELAEIDAVFFGAAGKPAEELRAGRTALVEKFYAQDPAAFREMVEAGVRILGRVPSGQRPAAGEREAINAHTQRNEEKPAPGVNANGNDRGKGSEGLTPEGVSYRDQVVSQYREFERGANAELEKSVGGAIGRAMEAALPNLRKVGGEGPFGQTQGKQAPPLQERLSAAVREEVETALRSDASLGEQVARVLSGRRFDEAARTQVVRLIDARAQQLVPGSVRRVVGAWTQATLGVRKSDAIAEERRVERAASPSRTPEPELVANRSERAAPGRGLQRGRVDYRKLSDEQILEM